jgi:NAD-dependent DNA ligase
VSTEDIIKIVKSTNDFDKRMFDDYESGTWPEQLERKEREREMSKYKEFKGAAKIVRPKVILSLNIQRIYQKTFVFTGFRNKDWENLITGSGGYVGTSVSRNTDYLIVKDSLFTSSKLNKAIEYGVYCVYRDDFEAMFITGTKPAMVREPRRVDRNMPVVKKEKKKDEFEEPVIKTRKLRLDDD